MVEHDFEEQIRIGEQVRRVGEPEQLLATIRSVVALGTLLAMGLVRYQFAGRRLAVSTPPLR